MIRQSSFTIALRLTCCLGVIGVTDVQAQQSGHGQMIQSMPADMQWQDLEGLENLQDFEGLRGPHYSPLLLPSPESEQGDFYVALRKLQEKIFRPIDPGDGGDELTSQALTYRDECQRYNIRSSCRTADDYSAAGNRLAEADRRMPGCGPAVRDFNLYYRAANPPAHIASAYDLNCLGSFSARQTVLPFPETSETHARGGAREARSRRLLGSIGLLEDLTLGLDGRPAGIVCSGLLLSPGRFVTAKHCLRSSDLGNLRVSAADGSFKSVVPDPAGIARAAEYSVADDWVVLGLSALGERSFAPVELLREPRSTEVNIVSYYPHFAMTGYVGRPDPRESSLRYQLDGMCQAIQSLNGCLEISCQSIRSFSGAPIFRDVGEDQPLQVIGFVSGNKGNDTGCATPDSFTNTTLAVSADRIVLEN